MLLEREIKLIFVHVQGVKKNKKRKNDEESERREAKKSRDGKTCHRLNTSARDLEGQGVSPVWNAAGTRWRTNSLLEALSLSLSRSLPPFLSLSLSVSSPSPQLHRFALRWLSSHLFPCFKKQHVNRTTSYFTCLGSYLSLSLSLSFLSFRSSYVNLRSNLVPCIPLLYNSLLNKDCILTWYRGGVDDSDCRL